MTDSPEVIPHMTRRHITDSPQLGACKSTGNHDRVEDVFTHPWRCDSGPYKPLPITYHKPIYNTPCYLDDNLNTLSKGEKVKKIMSYHVALHREMNLYAQEQTTMVLLGDPLPNKASQLKNGDTIVDNRETYVTRGGRHCKKRQNFTMCGMIDEEDIEKEKSVKKVKLTDEATTPKSVLATKRTAPRITNKDIMARSSLFADSPVVNKSPRTEMMFSKLEDTDKENRKVEIQKRKFEQTLVNDNSDDDLEISSTQVNSKVEDKDEDDFIRRRIEPPLPQKKGRPAALKYSNQPSTSSLVSEDDFSNNGKTLSQAIKSVNGNETPPTSNTKRGAKKKITICPICGESFPIREIEEHASTCGLTNELEIESSIPNQRADTSRF